MSKHKKPLHPATIKHVEAITGQPVNEDYTAAIAATFPESVQVSMIPDEHEEATSRHLRELPDVPEMVREVHREQVRSEAKWLSRMDQPHEEYRCGEVGSFTFLAGMLNDAAAEGRWRLHTVEITSATCRYVLVREQLG